MPVTGTTELPEIESVETTKEYAGDLEESWDEADPDEVYRVQLRKEDE